MSGAGQQVSEGWIDAYRGLQALSPPTISRMRPPTGSGRAPVGSPGSRTPSCSTNQASGESCAGISARSGPPSWSPTISHGQATEAGPFGLIRHNVTNGMSLMLIQEPGIGALGDYDVSSDGIVADVEGEVRVYDLLGNNPVFVAEISANSAGRDLDDQVVMWTDIQHNTWTLYVHERP